MLLLVAACSAPASESTIAVAPPEAANTVVTTSPDPTTTTAATTTSTTPPQFTISTVDAVRLSHSWHEGCPVDPTELRLLTIAHWDFAGYATVGELVIHRDHAEAVVGVFETLFEAGYPIESIIPIGDLEPGAEDQPGYDNTSGFNCRFVAGTTRWSEHARGLAIDINPRLNPLVDGGRIVPVGSERYVDRTLEEPGMITPGDEVVTAFESAGWQWGGYWTSLKDYHHFSATGR